jgi:hypothetical protein
LNEVCGFLQVELNIEPGQSLGLMIRGGVYYNLGIFITGVAKDSVADRAGLMVSVMQYLHFTFRKMFWRKADYLLTETRNFMYLNDMPFRPVSDHQFLFTIRFHQVKPTPLTLPHLSIATTFSMLSLGDSVLKVKLKMKLFFAE